MATYFIGDLHGCYTQLMDLLALIDFKKDKDQLWFSGDLVNKGPLSYKTIKFIMELKNANSILGNHDLHFLALSQGLLPENKNHNLNEIIKHEDCADIVNWLRNRPLIYSQHNNTLVHAGIHPTWTLADATIYANEVEKTLQGPDWLELLKNMYGNSPSRWNNNLQGWLRLRVLINIFTRMRYLSSDLALDFSETDAQPTDKSLKPWYECHENISHDSKVYFGHWASLQGKSNNKQFISIDGGCVWGGQLIAIRIEDCKQFKIAAKNKL
ncbi:MAG: symmetrical bis(5'-nucleosyl)-tetraphosphatase [Legionellales bacterium]|jgi:bis(5'-nucleosyl)-tetraphosphatase (symmetrical)|nr:symmetrical bis(5'-nucleosyl)-tetraphosphatase [Legionellales bacterium]